MFFYNAVHLPSEVFQQKQLIYKYKAIWHHSVTFREVRNDTVSSNYTNKTQFGVSLDIVLHQLTDTEILRIPRLELNNSQICLMVVKRSFFQSSGLSSTLSKQRWPQKNRKRFSNLVELKTKWLSGKNYLYVERRFTPRKPLKYVSPKSASSSILWATFTKAFLSVDLL